MILRIGRRSSKARCWEAASLLLRPQAGASLTTAMAATAIADGAASSSRPRCLSSLLPSRGFASQPAAIAADDSYDNQPGFDEDEEVTVNTWLQGKTDEENRPPNRSRPRFDVVRRFHPLATSKPSKPQNGTQQTTAAASSSPASCPSRSPSTRPRESSSGGTRAHGSPPRGC
jgi:hypothetical protein